MTRQQPAISRSAGVLPAPRALSGAIITAWLYRHGDLWAVLGLLGLTVLAGWRLVVGGTMVGVDTATYYYPIYSFLGSSLRSGNIPEWNPYSFAGLPFAADPQSGWLYAPTMLLFTLLPMEVAARGLMLLTLLLAGVGVYALARALGMGVAGSLVAGIAYEFTGYLYERDVSVPVFAAVAAWLPVLLLCAEMAIRRSEWLGRLLWTGAAGLALSQILSVWTGQGSYYALLALGAYIAYRTLFSPPPGIGGAPSRGSALILIGAGVLVFGFGLAAGGLLPRLEFNAVSNLAGGYRGAQAASGGWVTGEWARMLDRTGSTFYAGGATLALALLAPFVARRRHATPYWTFLAVVSLVLTLGAETPVHRLAFLLPAFERLHPHFPGRILTLFYLGLAMLAGATWNSLSGRGRNTVYLAALPALGWLALRGNGVAISTPVTLALLSAILLIVAAALLPSQRLLVSALLILVVSADLLAAAGALIAVRTADPGAQGLHKVDLEEYYEPSGAAMFLRERIEEGPVRYLGYDPSVARTGVLYRARFAQPDQGALLVNNRAVALRLQDVQGYNPVHIARYDEFLTALNGRTQEYRESYVYGQGLSSPLLNLLNARYIVAPADTAPEWTEVRELERAHPTVYEDSQVKVLENQNALPRAWIVHSARQVQPGTALGQLLSGEVYTGGTALIEEAPPQLLQAPNPAADRAEIALYEPDMLRVRTDTSAPGMLMLSEAHYPAWKAYVDNKPAKLYVADHALRAVAIPPGEHVVELRYESAALQAGLSITAVFLAILGALAALACMRRWRSARGNPGYDLDGG